MYAYGWVYFVCEQRRLDFQFVLFEIRTTSVPGAPSLQTVPLQRGCPSPRMVGVNVLRGGTFWRLV